MRAGTGRLPGQDVFRPALSFRLYDGGTRHSPGREQSRDNHNILEIVYTKIAPAIMVHHYSEYACLMVYKLSRI